MPSLAETQLWIRRAVVDGDTAGIPPQLIGGRDPRRRLAIHQRHYRSSLVAAIRTKFPATALAFRDAVSRRGRARICPATSARYPVHCGIR